MTTTLQTTAFTRSHTMTRQGATWSGLQHFLTGRWQPGCLAVNQFGVKVDPRDPSAVQFSVGGAIIASLAGDNSMRFATALSATCAVLYRKPLMVWEDEPGRTWRDILHLLDVAQWVQSAGLMKEANAFLNRAADYGMNPSAGRAPVAVERIRAYAQGLKVAA